VFTLPAANVEGMRFILISDGQPDDERTALDVAKTYKNRIDVIFVGSELSPYGREFLERLSRATGGTTITSEVAKNLKVSVEKLLLNIRTVK
jgi:Mg-chelatase subunit ChlD